MKKLKPRNLGNNYGVANVNGKSVLFGERNGEIAFCIQHLIDLNCGSQWDVFNLRNKAEKLGEMRKFRDAPKVKNTGGYPENFVTAKFVYENMNLPAGALRDLLHESGANINEQELPPVATPVHSEMASAADTMPAPTIQRTHAGEDTIVFKGENILQRLFGGLFRG